MSEPIVEYVLTATVDGEEVYRQSSSMIEIIEMSTENAQKAVEWSENENS